MARSGPLRTTAQVARAAEILGVLSANGFYGFIDAAGLGPYAPAVRVLGRLWPGARTAPLLQVGQAAPVRLRAVLEQLGPTFVKGGQLLALRPDLLPAEYAEELRSLQAHATPFPASESRRIVEAELGGTLEELYAEFEAEPFAAASLSQVHRARLADGRRVAVKVQRPGVDEQFEKDVALLALLARRLEKRVPAARSWPVQPTRTVAELGRWSRRELDFTEEARTAQAVAAMFEGDPDVLIPAIHAGLTTRRVLTMDFVEGVSPTSRAVLVAAGIDPDRVVDVGTRAVVRQAFGFGLFHADPHPGNLLVQPGGRVAMLDFGMFGRLSRAQRRHLGLVLWAVIEKDTDAVADLMLELAEPGAGADPDGFREDLDVLLREWARQVEVGSVPQLLLSALGAGGRHRIPFPPDLVLLARALITLEGTVAAVAPDTALTDLLGPALPELKRSLVPDLAAVRTAFAEKRFDYMGFALDLPDLLADLVPALRRGLVTVTRAPSSPPPPPPPPPPRRGGASTAAVALSGVAAGLALARWRAQR